MTSDGRTLFEKESALAFWMLAPTFTVVFAFVVFPVLWNIWLSLKPVSLADLRGSSLFDFNVTLGNFRKVFGDPEFSQVLTVTLIYTLGGSLFSILLGLTAALLLHEQFPGRGLLRGLLISPYIAPVVAVTFTWSFILDPQLGVLNWLAVKNGLLSQPVPFLSQRWLDLEFMGRTWRLPLALTSSNSLRGVAVFSVRVSLHSRTAPEHPGGALPGRLCGWSRPLPQIHSHHTAAALDRARYPLPVQVHLDDQQVR